MHVFYTLLSGVQWSELFFVTSSTHKSRCSAKGGDSRLGEEEEKSRIVDSRLEEEEEVEKSKSRTCSCCKGRRSGFNVDQRFAQQNANCRGNAAEIIVVVDIYKTGYTIYGQ